MSTDHASSSRAKRGRCGVLDIGSNSVRLVIYEVCGSAFVPIYNEKISAGLGRDLRETGRLSLSGKAAASTALARFALICKAQGVDPVLVGATAAMREAKDAPEFIAEIKAKTDFDLSPISGADEARLSAMGLLSTMPRADGMAADLGGASLELINIRGGQPQDGVSFPLGPFRLLGKDLTGEAFQPKALRARITAELDAAGTIQSGRASQSAADIFAPAANKPLYLIGGAWRNLAAIEQARTEYPLRVKQAYKIETDEALAFSNWAAGPGRETVINWPGLPLRRGETLPYGALLLSVLIERLEPSCIIISEAGLREGLVFDSLEPTQRARDVLEDGCRNLASGNVQGGASFAEPLYKFLLPASAHFPKSFPPETEERLRRAACILAGMGKGLHRSYRADLVFEDILYAPLAGLSHKQHAYLALMLYRSFTGKNNTPNEPALERLLSPQERACAAVYGLAIRLAVVASGRSAPLLKPFTLEVIKGEPVLNVHPEYENLLGERLHHRLRKLAEAMRAA